MDTIQAGHALVEMYNRKKNKRYTVEQFFDKVYAKTAHLHDKQFMNVQNCIFAGSQSRFYDDLSMAEKYKLFKRDIAEVADAKTVPGWGSSDLTQTTSFNTTFVDLSVDDRYAAWIGANLALMVHGGLCLIINNMELLWDVFEGWSKYRRLLNTTPQLCQNQINKWNTNHIIKKYGGIPYGFDNDDNEMSVKPVSWSTLFFCLASKGISGTAFTFMHGKTNTTVGYVLFDLATPKRLIDLYTEISDVTLSAAMKELLVKNTAGLSFERVAQKGRITMDSFNPVKNNDIIYNKTWLRAMLNDSDIVVIADDFGDYLDTFQDTKARRRVVAARKAIFAAKNKNEFLNTLTQLNEIVDFDPAKKRSIAATVTAMDKQKFNLFIRYLAAR